MIELTLKFEEASEEMIRNWEYDHADVQIIGMHTHPITFVPVALLAWFPPAGPELDTLNKIAEETKKVKYYYATARMHT